MAGKTTKKKDELTAFQATNKAFEEQVNHGSNTLTSWANIQRRTTYKQEFVQPRTPVSPEFPVQDGILNKFMLRQH